MFWIAGAVITASQFLLEQLESRRGTLQVDPALFSLANTSLVPDKSIKQLGPCAAQCKTIPPLSGEGSCCPQPNGADPQLRCVLSWSWAGFDPLALTLPDWDGHLWAREGHGYCSQWKKMPMLLCSDMILHQAEGNLALRTLAAYLTVNVKHRWTSKTVPVA